jgi:pimeloyl-ACP methyl ester carboxylesterase
MRPGVSIDGVAEDDRPEPGLAWAHRRPRRRDVDIILVPGLWLTGSAWDAVARELEVLGHRPVSVTLPGQGDGSAATYDDQVAAVVAAVDAADGPAVVVGHSAAATLAWAAADARPERVATVVLVGGVPAADGQVYFDGLPAEGGVLAFPGWEPFEGPDARDLDDEARRRFEEEAVPVPEAVVTGRVRLRDERRYDVPVVLVCPEFTPEQAKEWIAGDVPELAHARHLSYVDIDTGHWPMVTAPRELARLLGQAADDAEAREG